jgi:para-aminobenzoate synthetase
MKTLIIDNYDSYTYNIYQMVAKMNQEEPIIIKNDEMNWDELCNYHFDNIIISPGPGRPDRDDDFGLSKAAIKNADVPVLGVCLGHQGIGYLFGGEIVRAPEIMHGRLSQVHHNGSTLFTGIPREFHVVRYHSLVIDTTFLSEDIEVIAWTKDDVVMGLRHKELPLWGVQFHPESICTEYGEQIFRNFHTLSLAFNKKKRKPFPSETLKRSAKLSTNNATTAFDVNVKELSYREPATVFQSLFGNKKYSFWLDSNDAQAESRYSFMGDASGPYSQILKYSTIEKQLEITSNGKTNTVNQSIFDYMNNQSYLVNPGADLPFPFQCGYVGYFGYELKQECNPNSQNRHHSKTPDAYFIFADRVIVHDHLKNKMFLLCLSNTNDETDFTGWFNHIEKQLDRPVAKRELKDNQPCGKVEFKLNKSYADYVKDIEKIQDYLIHGETYEVNYTTRIGTKINVHPLELYLNLRNINPAPYSAYLHFDETRILSSSPEKFITIHSNGDVVAKPIKGTIKKSPNMAENLRLKNQLETSEKDRAENLMIVDLLRNDLGKVCKVGSIHVPKLMEIESFKTVHHMVSSIKGVLKDETTAVDCFKSVFPGGSMTGAPKIRTMQIIDELEGEARGIYSGSVGYFSLNGSADFNIVIRTITLENDQLTIGVGGAVTIQSTAEGEYDEMLLKADALLKSIVTTLNGTGYYIIGDKPTSKFKAHEDTSL